MDTKHCKKLEKILDTPSFKEFIKDGCEHRSKERIMEKHIRKTIPNYRIFIKSKFTQKKCEAGLKKLYYIDCWDKKKKTLQSRKKSKKKITSKK